MTSMTQHQDYYHAVERRLQQLELELQELARRTEQSVPKPSKTLTDLRASFDEKVRLLRRKLAEARDAGGSASQELRFGVEMAWRDLQGSLERARDALTADRAPSNTPAA